MKPAKKRIVVLASGGLDSAVLIGCLLVQDQSVQPIYVRSGHFWEEAELFWLKRFLKAIDNRRLKPLVCLSLPTKDLYPSHWSFNGRKIPGSRSDDKEVYLPGKNIFLIAKASVFCALNGIPSLALGSLKTNPFPDAHPSFFRMMERLCTKGLRYRIHILAPFLKLTKKEVMQQGCGLPLELTFSCLSPKKRVGLARPYAHCGRCNKCAERKKAFRNANLIDRTPYAR